MQFNKKYSNKQAFCLFIEKIIKNVNNLVELSNTNINKKLDKD